MKYWFKRKPKPEMLMRPFGLAPVSIESLRGQTESVINEYFHYHIEASQEKMRKTRERVERVGNFFSYTLPHMQALGFMGSFYSVCTASNYPSFSVSLIGIFMSANPKLLFSPIIGLVKLFKRSKKA